MNPAEIREYLNRIYEPLHRQAIARLDAIQKTGYTTHLRYFNLHEVKVNGAYQKEYFPMPVIEVEGISNAADVSLSLDGSAWLELTVDPQVALLLDYAKLYAHMPVEVYGASGLLVDFLNK